MGWLRKILYGTDENLDDASLPKNVRDWQENGGISSKSPLSSKDEGLADGNSLGENKTPEPDKFHSTSGSKILPNLVVNEVESHPSSDMSQLELWITLQNDSPYDIEITKVELLRQNTDPDRHLRAGESYEIRVYRGQTPRTNAETKAFIELKINETGDYFRQQYMIEYDFEQVNGVNWYVPRRLKKSLPAQDI